jgi:hypothetical protein
LNVLYTVLIIVYRDMVWNLGKLQGPYNRLRFYVEMASPCTNRLKLCLLALIFQQYGRMNDSTGWCHSMIAPLCQQYIDFHRAQVCINADKKTEKRLWSSFQTISWFTISLVSLFLNAVGWKEKRRRSVTKNSYLPAGKKPKSCFSPDRSIRQKMFSCFLIG